MTYKIKAKLISGSDNYYYFMGFTKLGRLPQWESEHSTKSKKEWSTKSSLNRALNEIKRTHVFPNEFIVEANYGDYILNYPYSIKEIA